MMCFLLLFFRRLIDFMISTDGAIPDRPKLRACCPTEDGERQADTRKTGRKAKNLNISDLLFSIDQYHLRVTYHFEVLAWFPFTFWRHVFPPFQRQQTAWVSFKTGAQVSRFFKGVCQDVRFTAFFFFKSLKFLYFKWSGFALLNRSFFSLLEQGHETQTAGARESDTCSQQDDCPGPGKQAGHNARSTRR